MAVSYDKFYSYLDELLNNYTKLSGLLREKHEAAGNFDIARLDEIIKEEQVYLLIAKGFDKNTENFRKGLNLEGETLGEAVRGMPDSEKPRFSEMHEKLSEAVNKAKALNDECQSLMKEQLHEIEKKLKEHGKPAETAATYSNPKVPGPGGGHSFSKSV